MIEMNGSMWRDIHGQSPVSGRGQPSERSERSVLVSSHDFICVGVE